MGKFFLELKSNIDKPLSAILSLNTIAHTIGAAGVGAQAVKIWGYVFGSCFGYINYFNSRDNRNYSKTMGARYWRTLSKVTYHIINIMLFLTYPLVIFSTKIMDIISKEKEDTTSREEIAALANIGVDEGVFSEKEK